MPSVITAFWWVVHNKDEVLKDAAFVVAAASALVKALEVLVNLLTTLFPQLKAASGELDSVAAWLDKLAKSPVLNKLALSPKAQTAPPGFHEMPTPPAGVVLKLLPLLVLLGGLGWMQPAHASPVLVSSGPTLPLLELRPGYAHPVSLAAGAGYQLSLTLPQFQRALGGKAWDLLDVSGMVFGSAVSSSSGQTFGALSVALGVCTLSSLICLGGGRDVVSAYAGGSPWFALFAFSLNFDVSPQVNAAASPSELAALPRGNHFAF